MRVSEKAVCNIRVLTKTVCNISVVRNCMQDQDDMRVSAKAVCNVRVSTHDTNSMLHAILVCMKIMHTFLTFT